MSKHIHARTGQIVDQLADQVGGTHYMDLPIQPAEYIHANRIGYFEGCVIKYVSRWRRKGGLQDLEKAKHYLDLLIGLEANEASNRAQEES
jgi:hypothetical protein